MNEWTALSPEQRTQFHASPDEIHRASETRDKRLLRHQLRKQKNVLFKAILEVGPALYRSFSRPASARHSIRVAFSPASPALP